MSATPNKEETQYEDLFTLGVELKTKMALLEKMGGIEGVAKALGTHLKTGIPAEEEKTDFVARRTKYGKNEIPKPPPRSLFSMVLEGLGDKTLIMLCIAACVSLVLGVWENPKSGWIEGTAILVAVCLVVSVSAGNDWQKERQFRKLNDKKNNKLVKVVRGGENKQVSVYAVNVGDVVAVELGDILCADGIFLSGFDIKCDESTMTGEPKPLPKGLDQDPFMLSSTKVVEGGMGKMLVCCVGVHAQAGKTLSLLNQPSDDTPLQIKLEGLADQIAKFGMTAAALILVSLSVKLGFYVWMGWQAPDTTVIVHQVLKFIITSITIVVVAVPEGLPLAVTISLAYSMTKMLRDNNLVRHLDACETMGGATTICSDKTGTLTLNKMTVMKGWFAGKTLEDTTKPDKIPFTPVYADIFHTAIAVNSTARTSINAQGEKTQVGSPTEWALLNLSRLLGQEPEKTRASIPAVAALPFSSARKRMTTVIKMPKGDHYAIFSTGAPDVLLPRCTHYLTENGEMVLFGDTTRKDIQDVITAFAKTGLRTLMLTVRMIKELPPSNDRAEYEKELETNLGVVFLAGIKDPVRPEVPPAVAKCQRAGIIVRMVTGDNIETAKQIARECGIIQSEDDVAIEGPVYRELPPDKRRIISDKLRVMARSSPQDKFVLVKTLKDLDHVVAVTGDGTNDAPALKESNIGFSMGITGTEVSKEASAIILMDDNFASIVKAAMWGRNVYDSIRKFLQFQLTVNMVAVLLAFIGALTNSHGEAPLKPVQLLWVNLIMDTMAALALATEEPSETLLDRPPYGKNDSLITKMMWRNVFAQGTFQLCINLGVLYYGHILFGVECESVAHLTCVFNIFVLCQLFNEINSRKLNGEINVFAGIFRNSVFVGVMIFTNVMQFIIVQFGGNFTSTTPLSLHQWMMCYGIAALGLVVSFIVKLFPAPVEAVAKPQEPKNHWGKIRDLKTKSAVVGAFKKTDEPQVKLTSLASALRRSKRHMVLGFSAADDERTVAKS
ncbi:calcium-translocating P-type ATPase [Pelomyxa schiedti]|nr:calcium-translocating P-type ATPase [Pelomyxa schiedti]